MLNREQKREVVAELGEKFGRATSVFVANYRGLSVEEVRELRGKLRGNSDDDYEYRVAKNSLLSLASEGHDAEVLKDHFTGPTAVAISYGDPVGLAKVLVDYAEEHEVFEIKGAVLDGKALDKGEVAHLATLPNLLELRGKLVGLLQAPAAKLARLLNEPAGQMARLVAARKDSLEE
ncbi:MAG: 50S ribosomal protein L10 [Myxococcota bacterium]|nr:50S ribosomal protein L10 [Myxococcota bacterium]